MPSFPKKQLTGFIITRVGWDKGNVQGF